MSGLQFLLMTSCLSGSVSCALSWVPWCHILSNSTLPIGLSQCTLLFLSVKILADKPEFWYYITSVYCQIDLINADCQHPGLLLPLILHLVMACLSATLQSPKELSDTAYLIARWRHPFISYCLNSSTFLILF